MFEEVVVLKGSFILVCVLAIAGCQLTLATETQMPSTSNRPSTQELRTACTQQASRQGLLVRSIGRFSTITGSRGREIGAAAPMEVSRAGRLQPVQCNYSFGDRQVRITARETTPPAPPQPTNAELRAACDRAAQSQRLGIVTDISSFRPVGGSQGRVIGAAATMTVIQNGQPFKVQCNYSFGDGQVRFTQL
jgi:hypothetical protein